MDTAKIAGLIMGGVTVAFITFVVGIFLVKILWAWTVPDLFPGAVQQGLVAGSISWLSAARIAICVAVLSGIVGSNHSHGNLE